MPRPTAAAAAAALRDRKLSHAQVRATRRELADRIRDDWTSLYKDTHEPAADGPLRPSVPLADLLAGRVPVDDVGSRSPAADADADAQPPPTAHAIDPDRVLAWREPYYASSDPSSDDDSATVATTSDALNTTNARAPPPAPASGLTTRLKRRSLRLLGLGDRGYERDGESEPASAANSDDLAATPDPSAAMREAVRRRHDRALRRRRRADAEAAWNDGLRHWERRREAWCCARRVDKSALREYPVEGDEDDEDESDRSSGGAESKAEQEQPQTSSRRSESHTSMHDNDDPSAARRHSAETSTTTALLPVAAPLLPTSDPTRSSMSPTLYPSIYSKVVVQGLTPSVPINLSHLLPALVSGWKADGDWPPPSSTTDPRSQPGARSTPPTRPPAPADCAPSPRPRPLSWLRGPGASLPSSPPVAAATHIAQCARVSSSSAPSRSSGARARAASSSQTSAPSERRGSSRRASTARDKPLPAPPLPAPPADLEPVPQGNDPQRGDSVGHGESVKQEDEAVLDQSKKARSRPLSAIFWGGMTTPNAEGDGGGRSKEAHGGVRAKMQGARAAVRRRLSLAEGRGMVRAVGA